MGCRSIGLSFFYKRIQPATGSQLFWHHRLGGALDSYGFWQGHCQKVALLLRAQGVAPVKVMCKVCLIYDKYALHWLP